MKELDALYGVNAVSELKTLGTEIALMNGSESVELHLAEFVDGIWRFEKVLTSEEVKQLEQEVNNISAEERQKNLMEVLPKLKVEEV
jgi:hypothetical protein